jgi:hypothetical protein
MPQFDICHQQVVSALQKDGWLIDAEQVVISTEKRQGFVDVRAAREVNGTRQQVMLVEVKCFPDRNSTTQELYIAIGQYIIYRAIMVESETVIPLYLAVPDEVFEAVFDSSVRWAVRDSQIKLVIVVLDREVITEWIE